MVQCKRYFHIFGLAALCFIEMYNVYNAHLKIKANENKYDDDSKKLVKNQDIKAIKSQIWIENELPGSPDWTLTNPAMNREVEGYMSRTSVQKGEKILLYYSVNSNLNNNVMSTQQPADVRIEVFRTGWYGGIGGRKVLGPVQVPGIEQIMPIHDEFGLIACKWKDPYVLQTSESWTTGIYLVKMTELNPTSMAQSYAIFVLRDDKRATAPDILFQIPFNTYQAYNIWGGYNLYRCNLHSKCVLPATKVSFDRPYAAPENKLGAFGTGAGEYLSNVQPYETYPINTTASWNYNMVRWLEKNNIDVSYVSNTDVHTRLPTLRKPKLFLTQGHDEYWTWAMRDHVTSWRDDGVDLAFLASNTAYWQIRYEDIDYVVTTGVPPPNDMATNSGREKSLFKDEEPRTIVCFRRANRDPDKSKFRSVKFRQVWPEALMVGLEYLFPLGDPFDEDLVVFDKSHWIFKGTEVKKGQRLPGLLGYEVDTLNPERLIPQDGNTDERISVITKIFETPLVNRKNETITSHGTIYKASSGANVFGSGTMQWSWGLDDYGVEQSLRTSRLNTVIEKMTWNLFEAAGIVRVEYE